MTSPIPHTPVSLSEVQHGDRSQSLGDIFEPSLGSKMRQARNRQLHLASSHGSQPPPVLGRSEAQPCRGHKRPKFSLLGQPQV